MKRHSHRYQCCDGNTILITAAAALILLVAELTVSYPTSPQRSLKRYNELVEPSIRNVFRRDPLSCNVREQQSRMSSLHRNNKSSRIVMAKQYTDDDYIDLDEDTYRQLQQQQQQPTSPAQQYTNNAVGNSAKLRELQQPDILQYFDHEEGDRKSIIRPRSSHKRYDDEFDYDEEIEYDDDAEYEDATNHEDDVGNFWSNPVRGLDSYPETTSQERRPPSDTRNRQRMQKQRREDDHYREEHQYTGRVQRRGGDSSQLYKPVPRSTFRSGTPPPPPFWEDFYNRLFWYGFDPTETTSAADKTMFGGTKGKFSGLGLLKESGLYQNGVRSFWGGGEENRVHRDSYDYDDRSDEFYYDEEEEDDGYDYDEDYLESDRVDLKYQEKDFNSADDLDDEEFYCDPQALERPAAPYSRRIEKPVPSSNNPTQQSQSNGPPTHSSRRSKNSSSGQYKELYEEEEERGPVQDFYSWEFRDKTTAPSPNPARRPNARAMGMSRYVDEDTGDSIDTELDLDGDIESNQAEEFCIDDADDGSDGEDNDSYFVGEAVDRQTLGNNLRPRRAGRMGSPQASPVFSILDKVFKVDSKEIDSRADDYDQKLGLDKRNGHFNSVTTPIGQPSRTRKGYAYRYVNEGGASTDDDVADEMIPDQTSRSDAIDVQATSDAAAAAAASKASKQSTAARTRRTRRQTWKDRADAAERVPPRGVTAWGPDGEIVGGMDARTKAVMNAKLEIRDAKLWHEAKVEKAKNAEEEFSALRADSALQTKRLMHHLAKYRTDDRRALSIRARLRRINAYVEDAGRALRRARAEVDAALRQVENIEDRHWALMSQFEADELFQRREDRETDDDTAKGASVVDKSELEMSFNETQDEEDIH